MKIFTKSDTKQNRYLTHAHEVLAALTNDKDESLLRFVVPGTKDALPPTKLSDNASALLIKNPQVKQLIDAVKLRAELFTAPLSSGEPISHDVNEIVAALVQAKIATSPKTPDTVAA